MGNKYRGSSSATEAERAAHGERDDGADEQRRDHADRTVQGAIATATTRGAESVEADGDSGDLPTVTPDSPLNDIEIGDELDDFEVFIVGGAVRDDLREGDRDPKDIDLMAVPRPEAEIENPITELDGRDDLTTIDTEDAFPVFQDSLGREVALPRTEESTGAGFKEFEPEIVPPDTPVDEAVEIDLERRDLRYNALAYSPESGDLHDPHGGREDLRDGRVRHVSEAFVDDPVRVLRMSRFAARFDHEVDEDTRALAREVAPALSEVPGERTQKEMDKAFKQSIEPRRFFDEARDANALDVALPEVAALDTDGTEGDETDAYDRTMETMETVQERHPNDRGGLYAALGRYMRDSSTPPGRTDDVGGADDDPGEQAIHSLANRTGMDGEAERTMLSSHRLGDEVMRLGDDDLSAEETVEMVGRLDGDRTALYTPEAAVDVASHDESFDADRAERRVERARDAIESVNGGTVFQAEGLSPDDIGPDGDLTGEEFGDLIDDYRVEEYRQADDST